MSIGAVSAPKRAGGDWPGWLCFTAVAVCVCWVFLGSFPLGKTEGHRAIPGWTALNGGHWWPTVMFDAVYVNKPPGMPWAVAGSSMVFGQTEFAARAVSAFSVTLAAVVAGLFCARWFGRRWGPAGAIGLLASGVMWATARSAEIEGLLCLFTVAAVLPIVDVLVVRRRSGSASRWVMLGLVVVGLVGGVVAKGPAALPTVGGVLIGCAIARRDMRTLVSVWFWGAVFVAGVIVAGLFVWMNAAVERAAESHEIIRQGVGTFLWSREEFVGIALFPVRAWTLALPAALGIVFVFGRDAVREARAGGDEDGVSNARAFLAVRAVAWSMVFGLLIGAVAGLSNPRYGVPTLVLAAPLVAYITRGGFGGRFVGKRERMARVLLGVRPWVWPALLCVSGAVYGGVVRPEGRSEGREAGVEIARVIEGDAEVWSSRAVYARPEVMWYAQRAAAERGVRVTGRWRRADLDGLVLPPVGVYMLLRDDEFDRYVEAGNRGVLDELVTVPFEGGRRDYKLVRIVER